MGHSFLILLKILQHPGFPIETGLKMKCEDKQFTWEMNLRNTKRGVGKGNWRGKDVNEIKGF